VVPSNFNEEVTVAGLYVHGARSSDQGDTAPTPMLAMRRVDVVEGCGMQQDSRYFHRGDPGRERPRQVSLIDEGTIMRHEARVGPIDRSFIKSQIILSGDLLLPDLLGSTLEFEDGAQLTLSIMRKPCFAMDLIAPGLKAAMEGGQQGALARVTRSGVVAVGQRVRVLVPSRVGSSQSA
jgi:hypothetical protein